MYNLFLDDFRVPEKARVHIPEYGMLLSVTRTRKFDWEIVRSHAAFVEVIRAKGIPWRVSFDHDLCEEHMMHYHMETQQTGKIDYSKLKTPTGVDSARFLVDEIERARPEFKTEFFIHSANFAGRVHIARALGIR